MKIELNRKRLTLGVKSCIEIKITEKSSVPLADEFHPLAIFVCWQL
jgi:hypothetical protein